MVEEAKLLYVRVAVCKPAPTDPRLSHVPDVPLLVKIVAAAASLLRTRNEMLLVVLLVF